MQKPPRNLPASTPTRHVLHIFAGSACLTIGACSHPLERIDRRADDLLHDRSGALGSDRVPGREYETPRSIRRPGQDDLRPPSVNPPPEELASAEADPDRDLVARLRRFAEAAAGFGEEGGVVELDLNAVFAYAQASAREYRSAEEDYIFAALRLLIQRHQWGPRLFNDTSLAFAGSAGDARHEPALSLINELRATQRLPYGGQVEAAWVVSATEQLRESATERYAQSSEIVLSASVPLLRGAGMVAREDLIQAERDLVYAARDFERFRRRFLVDIARDYFSLLSTLASISNQKRQIEILALVLAENEAKFAAGRVRSFEVNNARNDLLAAASSLANLRDRYIAQLDAFKIRIGMPVESKVAIGNLVFDLGEPDLPEAEAARRALEYRLDLQNRRDRLADAARAVRSARNRILPDLSVNASTTLPTDPDVPEGRLSFDAGEVDYFAGVTFGLPLDREIERVELRQTMLRYHQASRDLERAEDEVFVEARSALRAIDLARFDLRLAEQRVEITLLRAEEQTLRADEVTTQERLDTARALLDAYNARDQAATRLRTTILDYLLATDQLRVGREGDLLPLPGLDVAPVRLFEATEDLGAWYADPVLTPPEPREPAPGEP